MQQLKNYMDFISNVSTKIRKRLVQGHKMTIQFKLHIPKDVI